MRPPAAPACSRAPTVVAGGARRTRASHRSAHRRTPSLSIPGLRRSCMRPTLDAACSRASTAARIGAWQTPASSALSYKVSSLAVDPHRPRTVYASTGALGLFKSSDRGAHWRSLVSGLQGVDGVALDPSNPMNVLAVGSMHGVVRIVRSTDVRIVRSTDAGRTWAEAGFRAGVPGEFVVAFSGETAYAGSTYGWGLFGSTDGGRSWRRVGPPGVVYVQAVAIAPETPPSPTPASPAARLRVVSTRAPTAAGAGSASPVRPTRRTSTRSRSTPRTPRPSTSAAPRAASSRVRTEAPAGSPRARESNQRSA